LLSKFLQNPLACVPNPSDQCDHRGGRPVTEPAMKTFTIENETNNITTNPSAKEAEGNLDAERFSTEAEFAGLAENWSTARLIEIWNSLPGANPVKKFTDRNTAVVRIWKALQSLGGALPAEAAEPEAKSAVETPLEPEPSAEAVPTQPEPTPEPDAPTEPETMPSIAEPVTSVCRCSAGSTLTAEGIKF
jgi:hypothetical protein